MRFIYVLLAALFGIGVVCGADSAGEKFQATLRGNEISGVVVFSASSSGKVSGDAVIFYQGNLFDGKSLGTIQGDKLTLTFETAAKSGKPRVQGISGSIESPFSPDMPPGKSPGKGSVSLTSGGPGTPKSLGTTAIKADVARVPQLSAR